MSRSKSKFRRTVSLTLIAGMTLTNLPQLELMAAQDYNYAEALQKSLMFYEFQKSGKLPENQRNNWRGDSALEDGKDVGLDLTGGWFDAGDHVKFNLPMAYTSTMLAWSYLEDKDVYKKTEQEKYILDEIRWANDYFIKCHPSPEVYYYQVGNGNEDHKYWVSPEVMPMERPAYKVSVEDGGSTVCASTAASLASAAIIFKDSDPAYSKECLKHAKELLAFAEKSKNDEGYAKEAAQFYNSWSGFYDDFSWASTWIYLATNDDAYLEKAKQYANYWGKEGQSNDVAYKWTHCWDDVHYGTALLLAKETNEKFFIDAIENNLDYWTTGFNGEKITYTPKGLAWLDNWGSLRYSSTAAFMGAVYSDWDNADKTKAKTYQEFAKTQADYALGSTGRSYLIGYGNNYPKSPHHRGAHGAWENNVTGAPAEPRHTLVGALVGGPGKSDDYEDDINNYYNNEVTCDYNVGFVGLMAKMYNDYGGRVIENLTANETVGEELFIEAGINGQDKTNKVNFVEFKTVVYNRTAWPARTTDKLSFRYFVDIKDVIAKGYKPEDMKVASNYSQHSVKVSKLTPWDAENGIYYVEFDLGGANIYPGGQSEHKCEVQFRISAPGEWDYTKSPSFAGLESTSSAKLVKAGSFALYDGGKLVYGKEPNGQGVPVPTVAPTSTPEPTATVAPTSTPEPTATVAPTTTPEPTDAPAIEDISVKYVEVQNWVSGFNGKFEITNNSDKVLSDWKLEFNTDADIINFWTAKEISHTGNKYIIAKPEWGIQIQPGETIELEFTANSGETNKFINFVLNDNLILDDTNIEIKPTQEPSATVAPTNTPLPTATAESTSTPLPTATVVPTSTPTPTDAPAIEDISVKYEEVQNWVSGFNGKFEITNNSDKTLSDWKLEFDTDADIINFWTAKEISHIGTKYIITKPDWGIEIQPGETIELGFTANSGETNKFTNLILNDELVSEDTDSEIKPSATPAPTQKPTPVPTQKPTATPVPTQKPTATPVPTQKPTATPVPTQKPNATPTPTQKPSTTPAPTDGNHDDWLFTDGNKIVDRAGNEVLLTGANWFGFNVGSNTFDGLWSCSLKDTIKEMANRGINIIRVPISTELLNEWMLGTAPMPTNINYAVNPELKDLNSLEMFDKFLENCKVNGVKVLLDVHSAETNAMGHLAPLWYNDEITVDTFYDTWEWVANRYKNDDTIIAYDLQNEPHGIVYQSKDAARWDDSEHVNNWKQVAEKCALKILKVNPNALILVEGIECTPKNGKDYSSTNPDDYLTNWWGGNLRGVKDYPINLGEYQNKLVYSPHDYGPAVHKQQWFYDGFNEETLYNDCWKDNWAYIHDENIAPILMGEWGGFMDGKENEKWMVNLRDYMIKNRISHTFWCFNQNSGDTGGLVEGDFTTWDEKKYDLLEPALWQTEEGQFIGLDHKVDLGENGTNVAEYYN